MAKKISFEVISFDVLYIKKFITKLLSFSKFKKGEITIIFLPRKKKKFSVLKSPFVNNKAVEQFSLKRYKRLVLVKNMQPYDLKKFLGAVAFKNIAVKIKGV